jgi:hypothetical protein
MYLKQLKVLPQPFDELVAEKAEIFKSNESCQRFATVSGIGPVIATAPLEVRSRCAPYNSPLSDDDFPPVNT